MPVKNDKKSSALNPPKNDKKRTAPTVNTQNKKIKYEPASAYKEGSFDFTKDYSQLSPEDQNHRSHLRKMIRNFQKNKLKYNTPNLFQALPRIFNRTKTNTTEQLPLIQEQDITIKEGILNSLKYGNLVNKLNLLTSSSIKILISNEHKNNILSAIDDQPLKKNKIKLQVAISMGVMKHFNYQLDNKNLKKVKEKLEYLLENSDSNDDTFVFKYCKPYLKIDNEFLNDLLENTISNNMIELIKSKEINLSQSNIDTLWEAEVGQG